MKLYEDCSIKNVSVNVNELKETLDFYHFPYEIQEYKSKKKVVEMRT